MLYALVPLSQMNGVNQLASPYCFSDGSTCFTGAESSIDVHDSFYESEPSNGGTPVYNGGFPIDTTMNRMVFM